MKIYKKYLQKITSLSMLLLFIVACNDPYADQVYTTVKEEDLPISSYLSNHPESFSLWTSLLKYTNTYNTLNLNADYTCFVPNDSAMNLYLKSNGYKSITDIDSITAKKLVKYHTITGKAYAATDFDDGIIPDTTATGDFLTMSITNSAVYEVNDQSDITKHITLSNGVVHVLNSVLTPITNTISQELVDNSKYSIFSAAVKEVGYYSQLNTLHKYFTAFVVPDSVYHASGINSLNDLESWLAIHDSTDGDSALYKYVGYHLIPEQDSYNELTTFDVSNSSKNISTMANNELITVSAVSDTLYFNYNTNTANNIFILQKNVSCKNGMIHVISGIMPIVSPKTTTITWDFTDYSEIATLYSSVYRLKTLKTSSTNYINSDKVTCYEWESVPNYNADQAVAYYVSAKSSSVMINATNYDYLLLSLGQFGWIKMNTCTIVKGTYKMTVNHYNPHSSTDIARLTFYIDGKEYGTVQTMGVSTSKDQFLKTSIGSITFSDTKSHAVEIIADDNNTSYIDGITFTPVN